MLISAEMCCMRWAADYTPFDHKRNDKIITELQMLPIKYSIQC
jgi:hypothetical protein